MHRPLYAFQSSFLSLLGLGDGSGPGPGVGEGPSVEEGTEPEPGPDPGHQLGTPGVGGGGGEVLVGGPYADGPKGMVHRRAMVTLNHLSKAAKSTKPKNLNTRRVKPSFANRSFPRSSPPSRTNPYPTTPRTPSRSATRRAGIAPVQFNSVFATVLHGLDL